MVQSLAFACTGEVKSPYRGSQKSVQGKSNPRTGEFESPYRGAAEPLEGRIGIRP